MCDVKELSREKLEEIKYRAETRGINAGYLPEEILTMVDRLLAAEAQEPVGEVVDQPDGSILDGTVHLGSTSTHRAVKGLNKMKRLPLGTKFYAAPQPVAVPDEIRHLQCQVTIWKDRWEGLCELFREIADELGCDVKDNDVMIEKIRAMQSVSAATTQRGDK